MSFNIVLVTPEIPNNTGNIGRLSLASGCNLHLIKPLGFDIDDARVKRSGLDYWKHVNLFVYENIADFFSKNKNAKMAFLSSHGAKAYWDIEFEEDIFLVFGKESKGLPESITQTHANKLYKIPLLSKHIRSINLANAVSVTVYEGIRQLTVQKTI